MMIPVILAGWTGETVALLASRTSQRSHRSQGMSDRQVAGPCVRSSAASRQAVSSRRHWIAVVG